MAKDAFWFPHDANARNDPDILDMRGKYGCQGYGWYWILIEMMREQSDYKLSHSKPNAYAMQCQCQPIKIIQYISDCVGFGLFESDGDYFWSNSLMRRMEGKDRRTEAGREAAKKRWDKVKECEPNANPLPTQCEPNAKRKEEKRREENTEEENVPPVVSIDTTSPKGDDVPKRDAFKPPTVEEVAAYCRERGNGIDAQKFCDHYQTRSWIPKGYTKQMKDWKAAVRTWERNETRPAQPQQSSATDGYRRLGE